MATGTVEFYTGVAYSNEQTEIERAILARCAANALPARELAMHAATNDRVIARNNNVLLVDFSRKPEPPAPRFPGAGGLREEGYQGCETTLIRPSYRQVCC
jgi:hypothetical protein